MTLAIGQYMYNHFTLVTFIVMNETELNVLYVFRFWLVSNILFLH